MADPLDRDQYEAELAGAVLEYLAQHPQAMDTAAGIAEWWVPAENAGSDLRFVRKVLDRLVQRGLLERIGIGEHAHYRLNSSRPQ